MNGYCASIVVYPEYSTLGYTTSRLPRVLHFRHATNSISVRLGLGSVLVSSSLQMDIYKVETYAGGQLQLQHQWYSGYEYGI